jgi:glycogen(starch) synthase
MPEKGFDLMLRAFARLTGRYPAARLTIAGDGPERDALKGCAADLGISQRVDFLGWTPPQAVPTLINAATIVVIPSRTETLGLVAIQAAQMARPVAAVQVGGLAEVVVHGETGILAGPEDSRALAEAIIMLLERPEQARQMGRAARERALDVFAWERHVDAYQALYRRVSGGPREHSPE